MTNFYTSNGVTFNSDLPTDANTLIVEGINLFDGLISRDYASQGVAEVNLVPYVGSFNGVNPVGPRSDWVKYSGASPTGPRTFFENQTTATPGRDYAYISTEKETDPTVNRSASSLAATAIHEMLHGSSTVNRAVEERLAIHQALYRILNSDRAMSGGSLVELRGRMEHVVIGEYMARIAELTDRRILSLDGKSLATYITELNAGLDEVFLTGSITPLGTSHSETQGLIETDLSSFESTHAGIITIAENDHSGVALYVNQNGQIVVTDEDTRYTENMLNTYGTEWVNSDGVLEGGMTFGATLRAFGDWLGLDGTPGLDGGFANDDEGSAAAGPGTGGAGGDSGSTSSGNDDNDGPKGIQSSPASGGPKPPPQPGGNPHPKPTPGPVDIDTPKGPKVLHPILLDLDGNGIQLTDLTRSTVFMEGQEGLKHRTAWAGAGDGVLFYDTDGDNAISDVREYVFTEWDPTAKDDLAALRSRFDANGDGRLTGTELTGFKVMRTNPDGSLTAVTLASLNITQINLKQDATRLVSTHEYKKFGSSIGLIVP